MRGETTYMATVEIAGPSSELNAELRDLGSRDLQLWSIAALVLTVVALGFMALVVPNLMSKTVPFKVETRYLPQLFAGFLVLIVLFNVYLIEQKRRVATMRDNLVRRMLMSGSDDRNVSRDRLTDAFDWEYVECAIAREQRRRSPYTLLMVDIADFRRINRRFGNLAGDHLLMVTVQIIRSCTRGSDIVCRYGGDEFLVLLAQTTPEQANPPIARIEAAVAEWNRTTNLSYSLELHTAVAEGPSEGPATAVLV
ncbi:MAG: GGDEF domain-containing protein, partial [Terriglobales bacterium]